MKTRKANRLAVVCGMIGILVCCGCTSAPTPQSKAPSVPYASSGPLPSFSAVVSKTLPSIAYLYVENGETDASGNQVASLGSGVSLRSDGWILTNKHVVQGYKSIQVTLFNRRSYTPTAVVLDDTTDLAALKIGASGLVALPRGNPDGVAVGDWVIAVGHALGISPLEGGPTVSEGVVSSLGRSFTMNSIPYYDLIQTSAAINPGNSGGALVNSSGEIVGINSAAVPSAQGIGYAINIGTAGHVFDDLVQYGKPLHPYLGVRITDVSTQAVRTYRVPFESALVESVDADSPAAAAGLQPGDAIIGLFGENVTSAADLIKVLWRHNPGEESSIVFLHRGVENKKDVRLADRAQSDSL